MYRYRVLFDHHDYRADWFFVVANQRAKAADAAVLRTRQVVEDARQSYQTALTRLKGEPTNADLKQQALELGRAYAALTREQKNVTVFDEVALSNDISAATAGATIAKAAPASSVEERLQALEGLRSKGLVSDAEYIQKRQKLIGEM